MNIITKSKAKKFLNNPPMYVELFKKFNNKTKDILMVINSLEASDNLKDVFIDLKNKNPEKIKGKKDEFSIRASRSIRIHFKVSQDDLDKIKDRQKEIKKIIIFDITHHKYK